MQRKIFRIEESISVRGERRRAAAHGAPQSGLIALHAQIADHKRDLSALIHDGEQRRITLAASELGAAVEGMEKATHGILRSAESADSNARALAASLAGDKERALTRGIQENLARIYEACNFHDLAGQRIGKVIETLAVIEAELARMLDGAATPSASEGSETGLINGPKLDGASGHMNQNEIDGLFG